MDLGCEQTNYEKMPKYLKDTIEEDLKPIDWITNTRKRWYPFNDRKSEDSNKVKVKRCKSG